MKLILKAFNRFKRLHRLTKWSIAVAIVLGVSTLVVTAWGHSEFAIAFVVAFQPIIITTLWLQNHSLRKLNQKQQSRSVIKDFHNHLGQVEYNILEKHRLYLDELELRTSHILNDLVRTKNEILDALENKTDPQ